MLYLLLLLAQGDPVVVARDALQPHLAASEDGTFHAVFIRGGNIEYARSSDQGRTWSAPLIALDAKGKARGGLQRGPRVAVDGKGTVYVSAPLCFDAAELEKRYPANDLYLAASSDGTSFSAPLQVNDTPRKAPEALHWLAAAPNGDVFVAWLDMRNREKGQDLGWAKVTEQGRKIGKNQILPGPICECCAPGLTVDAKGAPVLIFRQGGVNANRAIFLASGPTLSKVGRINQGESKVDS